MRRMAENEKTRENAIARYSKRLKVALGLAQSEASGAGGAHEALSLQVKYQSSLWRFR
jgi:hypothetical protein